MTADRTRPASQRARSFQDDLLADLRQAAPMATDRTTAPQPVVARTLPLSPLPVTDALPVLAREVRVASPTIQLRLTGQPWSMPGLRRHRDALALELSAGPIRLSLAYFGG